MTNHDKTDIPTLVTICELEAITGGNHEPTPDELAAVCGDKPLDLCQVWF
jgi:hypothetical protein